MEFFFQIKKINPKTFIKIYALDKTAILFTADQCPYGDQTHCSFLSSALYDHNKIQKAYKFIINMFSVIHCYTCISSTFMMSQSQSASIFSGAVCYEYAYEWCS